MQEDETFNEFYTKLSGIRNFMISLGNKVSDATLIKKINRSLPERFKIEVTTIEESKYYDTMKIEELVGIGKTKPLLSRLFTKKIQWIFWWGILPCLLEVLERWSIHEE